MSGRLGQYEYLDPGYGYDLGVDLSYDYSFDPGYYDLGFDTYYDPAADWGLDYSFDYGSGWDLGYDFETGYDLGYDVTDAFPNDPFYDTAYDDWWGAPDDYGDLYSYDTYDSVWDTGYDPASGFEDYSYTESDWGSWETAGASDLQTTYGGNDAAAAAAFSFEFPDVDWNKLISTGLNLYQAYMKISNPSPTGTAPKPQPGVTINPQTGQPMIRDPRTGQLVPAVRDPQTGMLVPQTAGAGMLGPDLISGVPNWALLAGVGVIAFMLMQPGGKSPRRRRRRRK